ncbi:MAG: hypothetical protein BWY23_02210 [Spirochaetes bacterium ADurb.Bin218]|jgi:hypothetical protein|nr:MAG: hypothetical protein BWY23_02210 [Spirochaetes bacterium ADurb.Bin218]
MAVIHNQTQKNIKDVILKDQFHLKYNDKINLGAFYTPQRYVNIVWQMIKPFIDEKTIVLDSSCGYGNFFDYNISCIKKANDIDIVACNQTKNNFPQIEVYNKNALFNVNRKIFDISDNDELIIIGNPPYNDTTSIIRNEIKRYPIEIDSDIKTRDLGMSFLLSYAKLNAEIVCVLHPLSYLIKKSNFNLLKNFTANYKLIDGVIIDSGTFKETSKGISFPIIIALYIKDIRGMDYNYILNYKFTTIDKKSFSLNDFDFISNYIDKYPIKNVKHNDTDILFWTMRDINALKRNRTFMGEFGCNTIIVDKNKLDYYIYVDVFKQFSYLIPYYFGNLEVFINNELFNKYKDYFIYECVMRNNFLEKHISFNKNISLQKANEVIIDYFKSLLGQHYVY